MSDQEETSFHQRHQINSIALLFAQSLSLLLFGITKSYLNSKPLGMQSLYDSCCILCINCFLIMSIINFVFVTIFLIFAPLPEFVSLLFTLTSYITILATFVCLFCVQIVRYLYFTYPVFLDYYDETTTLHLFKQTVFSATLILTFLEVRTPSQL